MRVLTAAWIAVFYALGWIPGAIARALALAVDAVATGFAEARHGREVAE
ncbi:hypothetical protein ACF07Q_28640 [Nocardiopsis dassonvillei]